MITQYWSNYRKIIKKNHHKLVKLIQIVKYFKDIRVEFSKYSAFSFKEVSVRPLNCRISNSYFWGKGWHLPPLWRKDQYKLFIRAGGYCTSHFNNYDEFVLALIIFNWLGWSINFFFLKVLILIFIFNHGLVNYFAPLSKPEMKPLISTIVYK